MLQTFGFPTFQFFMHPPKDERLLDAVKAMSSFPSSEPPNFPLFFRRTWKKTSEIRVCLCAYVNYIIHLGRIKIRKKTRLRQRPVTGGNTQWIKKTYTLQYTHLRGNFKVLHLFHLLCFIFGKEFLLSSPGPQTTPMKQRRHTSNTKQTCTNIWGA